MELLRYKVEMEKQWDEFVWQSRNGTIFHTQKFLSYHANGRFHDCSLMFVTKGHPVCIFPAAVKTKGDRSILCSHPGASYGGPVLSLRVDLATMTEIVEGLVRYARRENFGTIEMCLPPRVYHSYPCEEIDFSLTSRGFELLAVELSSAVLLSGGEEAWWTRFRSDTARSIRKAKKEEALTVDDSEDWEDYWRILENNLARHHVRPTHSVDEIQTLKRLFPDKIHLFAGYLGNVLIAGVVFFICNDRALHTFYFAQDYAYQRYRPLNLIVYRLMQWGYERNYRYLNLGISTENAGHTINWGLFRFKEGFGARGVLRKYYGLSLNGT